LLARAVEILDAHEQAPPFRACVQVAAYRGDSISEDRLQGKMSRTWPAKSAIRSAGRWSFGYQMAVVVTISSKA